MVLVSCSSNGTTQTINKAPPTTPQTSRGTDQLPLIFKLCFLDIRRTIPKSASAQIRTAYASGIGLREIARNMSIPEGTVLSHAKREGWTGKIQSAKAVAKPEETPLAVTPAEAVAMSIRQARRTPRGANGGRLLSTRTRRTQSNPHSNPLPSEGRAIRIARSHHAYCDFGASVATIFSKRGSPRRESQ